MRIRMMAFLATVAVVLAFGSALAAPDPNEEEGRVVALFECSTGKVIVDARGQNRSLTSGELKLAASGLCELAQYTNGTYYCKKGSCNGKCSLKNIPVYCSCEDP
jgi:hypothetical protein